MDVECDLGVDCATERPDKQPLAQLATTRLSPVLSLYILDQLLGPQEDQALGLWIDPDGAHALERDCDVTRLGDRMTGSFSRHPQSVAPSAALA